MSAPSFEAGAAAFRAGRLQEARGHFDALVRANPADWESVHALGTVLARLGEHPEAARHFDAVAAGVPQDAGLAYEHGTILAQARRHADAAAAFERCLRLSPAEVAAYEGLAKARLALDDEQGVRDAYERSVRATPRRAAVYWLAMRTYMRLGMVPTAVEFIRRGLAALPGDLDLLEFACFLGNLDEGIDPAAHLAEHRALAAAIERAAPARARTDFSNTPDPSRPLRVAFVSGDLRYHACAFFLSGLLRMLDRSRVSVICYSNNEPDETSRGFMRIAEYRDVCALDDAALVAQAARDAVDVAVDCSGWTGQNRTRAFARRLAPVQCTYLGYLNTTGLSAMDYRIVDAVSDPPGADRWCTERLARLPRCHVCYTPVGATPDAGASPGRALTFGSFNRLPKIGDATLGLWARVLEAVPGSRLLLKTEVPAGFARRTVLQRLADRGVDTSRVTIADYQPDPRDHLSSYRAVDIALDTVHHAGVTTTCEAAVMGVPTVTLRGSTHRSRVGASILTALGHPELIAETGEQYVAIAAGLATDPERLRAIHGALPDAARRSELCDAPGMARAFEACLRGMWEEWCALRRGAGA